MARAHVDDLRRRLLDLKTSNPLLSFRHSPRSRRHVRLIDEVPEQVWEALRSGKTMSFEALPEPPPPSRPEPPARPASGTATTEASAGPEAATTEAATTEPSAPASRRGPSEEEVARGLGLDPSYELPQLDPEAPAERHVDKKLQTLCFPRALERKLSGLRDAARLSLDELGFGTLFAAFGFLEWRERDDAERALHAPLLLLPLEIERKQLVGGYRYSITATGEEPQINLALAERLRRDLGLSWPELDEEEELPSYLARIEAAIQGRPGWSVRRFVTIGVFQFARLVMYRDLEPERWPSATALTEHPVLLRLLAGGERSAEVLADTWDLDDPEVAARMPPLVYPADSSQVSAILDALQGKNLALKGPPGTGKSQTITNLIAAALAGGQRVLFVAEKMAALEVVESRLRAAGLGPFCLELHSTKARKRGVLDSLGARLEVQGKLKPPSGLEARQAESEALRRRLVEVAAALSAPFGGLGPSGHEVLWREQRARAAAAELPPALAMTRLPDAGARTAAREAEDERRVAGLLAAAEAVEASGDAPHPWRFLRSAGLGPLDAPALRSVIEAWRDAHTAVIDALAACPGLEAPGELAVDAARDLAFAAAHLPEDPDLDAGLLAALAPEPARKALGRWYEAAQRADEASAAVAATGSTPGPLLAGRDRLDALERALADEPSAAGPLQGLERIVDTHRAAAARLEERLRAGAAIARIVGLPAPTTGEALLGLLEASALIDEAPRPALLARAREVLDEANGAAIEAASARIAELRSRRAELAETLRVASAPDGATLRAHAQTLRSTGFFGRFGGAFGAAKAAYQALARSAVDDYEQMAAALDRLADQLEAEAALAADARVAAAFGPRFAGLDTELDTIAAARAWAARVRAAVPGVEPERRALRSFLLEAEIDALDAVRAAAGPEPRRDLAAALEGVEGPLEDHLRALRGRADALIAARDAAVAAGLAPSLECGTLAALRAALDRLAGAEADVEAALADWAAHGPAPDRSPAGQARALSSLSLAVRLGDAAIPAGVQAAVLGPEVIARLETLRAAGRASSQALESLGRTERAAGERGAEPARLGAEALGGRRAALDAALAAEDRLPGWLRWLEARSAAAEGAVGLVLDALEQSGAPLSALPAAFELARARSLAAALLAERPILAELGGAEVEALRARYRTLESEIERDQRAAIAAWLAARPVEPGIGSGPKRSWTEAALIQNELSKRQRHLPIRQLMERASRAVQDLKPCFMMSPLSVAQFVPPGTMEFDLVVVDEASQMRPEDAIGAIARGKHFVVVGDPMQLPPTSFFDRALGAEEEIELDEDERDEAIDSESVLDLALSLFQPARDLRWHYRSRHESLIRFSNHHFYDDRLVVVPSPETPGPRLGVTLRPVEGRYAASCNEPEAQAVADAVVAFATEHPDRSLGVVAMNQKQRELIAELIDARSLEEPALAAYQARWAEQLESFFVKNLENVQGDERDVMFVSMTYGPDAKTGRVYQRFGPVGGAYGHRRLNVLFTRAKEQIVVFSSLAANDVKADADARRGVRAMRDYLGFAATGSTEHGRATGRSADSPFELEVAEALSQLGYELEPQVGVGDFFVDLGVRHPAFPNGYLCGVECDGAAFHSSACARDRDRVREEVLRRLGWRLVRVWSTDWFRDPAGARQKLVREIEAIRAERS